MRSFPAKKDHGRKSGIRPAIDYKIDVHGYQLAASRVTPVRCLVRDGWRLVVADHIFRAVVNNFSTEFPGLPGESSAACAAIIDGYSSLPPKPPPGFRLNHANFFPPANQIRSPAPCARNTGIAAIPKL